MRLASLKGPLPSLPAGRVGVGALGQGRTVSMRDCCHRKTRGQVATCWGAVATAECECGQSRTTASRLHSVQEHNSQHTGCICTTVRPCYTCDARSSLDSTSIRSKTRGSCSPTLACLPEGRPMDVPRYVQRRRLWLRETPATIGGVPCLLDSPPGARLLHWRCYAVVRPCRRSQSWW